MGDAEGSIQLVLLVFKPYECAGKQWDNWSASYIGCIQQLKRKNILTLLSMQLICWKCNIFKCLSWNIKWNNAYNLFCMAWNAQFLFNLMLQNTTWEADSVLRSPTPPPTFVSAEWDVDTDWIIRRSTMRGGGSIFF